MKKWISIFALSTALSGCWLMPARNTENTLASVLQATSTSIETAQTTAVLFYRFEQEKILSDGLRNGATKAQVLAQIAELRIKWTPTWMLLAESRDAYNTVLGVVRLMKTGEAKQEDFDTAQLVLQNKLTAAEQAMIAARGD